MERMVRRRFKVLLVLGVLAAWGLVMVNYFLDHYYEVSPPASDPGGAMRYRFVR